MVLNRDHVERSKQRIDARKWLLSKALPKVYGDRQSVEGKLTVDWAQVCQEATDKYNKEEGASYEFVYCSSHSFPVYTAYVV
jgi:hypothetical protein